MLKELEDLGLSKGETKVYLALFELKEGTKHSIARIAGVSESKIYEILDKLIKKGLVSSITKNNIKRFYPANPNKLQDYVNKKKNELEKEQKIVDILLPQLFQKISEESELSKVEVFEGFNGIKSVLEELKQEFDSKYEWIAMGITSSKKEIFNRMWTNFHKERVRHKIKCRFIFTDKGTSFYNDLSSMSLTSTKVIKQITPSGVAIYKNKTLILYYGKEPSCIFITNKEISQSFTEFFNGIWKISKS
ncbi:MAG: hypothetical protein CMH63_03705 [Nanoarchaeota archaeon]|jgi:sugar-specific transcriptional regulator TrmB|nr:hypothetical protein [Nanoarchaeota archaeon]|tara:strand:+ start:28050 stop:28793 length:744 start_codon:yes stop_codon:yes gene_type:complete